MADPRSPRRFSSRTRSRLALGGLAAAAGVTLSGCDGTPDFQDAQFTTVTECVRAGFPDNLCQSSYNAAYLEHQRSAPKFNTLQSCQEDWGAQCMPEQAASAGSGLSIGNVFVPMLAGFVVSQALQRRYHDDGDIDINYYGGYGGYRGSPIYRNRSGATITFDRSGSSGKAIAKPVNVNTTTVARSGFGGMGKSRGGFGG